MRRLSIAALIAAPFVAIALAASADNLTINYKPGLWNMTMTSDGVSNAMKMCIDPTTSANMMRMGTQVSKDMCSSQTMNRVGNTLTTTSVCKMMKSTITSKAVYVFTGDTGYKGTINSTYSPPLMGKSSDQSQIEAKWSGACPAGVVPGDMIMPGGIKMHFGKDGKPSLKPK